MKGGACCTVSSCRNSTAKKGIKFFRFPNPREPERSKRWILACNRKDLLDKDPYYLYKNRRICSIHFPDTMYLNDLKNRLIATAEPTLNLGFATTQHEDGSRIQYVSRMNLFGKSKKPNNKNGNTYFTPKARVVNCENSTSTLLDIDLRSYNLNEHPSMDNLPKICRVCFMEENVQDIFDLKFDKLLLSDIVQLHTTVKLHKDGIIPHKMCISCIEELTRSYLFFKKFQNADKVLNEIAQKDKLIILNKSLHHGEDSCDMATDCSHNSSPQQEYIDVIDNPVQNQKFEIEIIDGLCENSLNFNVMSNLDEDIDISEEIVTLDDDDYKALVIDFDDANVPSETGMLDDAIVVNENNNIDGLLEISGNLDQKNFTNSNTKCNEDKLKSAETLMKLQCDKCAKYFSSVESLKKHVRKHINPHRVTCYVCSKTYSSKTALKTHFLTHTGEKPFRCEICTLQFRQHSHYLTHKRTHTGEKPFVCRFCSACFASTGLLDMHVRKKHTNQPICRCSDCGQGFFEKRMLRKHRISKHGESESNHSPLDNKK